MDGGRGCMSSGWDLAAVIRRDEERHPVEQLSSHIYVVTFKVAILAPV